jgi:hypothetical protein
VGNAEVPENNMPIIVYEQIFRFDVSMNDSFRMRVFDGYELGVDVRQMKKGTNYV